MEYTFLHEGHKAGIDPNLLVGLANRESSLNPSAVNGDARGIFQTRPSRQADLGISNLDIFNSHVQIQAVSGAMATALNSFSGNRDLAY